MARNNYKFLLETDWIFQGYVDSEHREYILLDYFKKMGKYLEEIKIYPMFLELSLHLGNIHTLINENKILYVDKEIPTPDYELIPSDLKLKDIPVLTEEEEIEYRKILKQSEVLIKDYFNFAKSLWSVVYDSIEVKPVFNKKNIDSKVGFFYYRDSDTLRIWKYTTRKVYKVKNQTRTSLNLIYEGDDSYLTIQKIISKFSKTYITKGESTLPIFEVFASEKFPIKETLTPMFKRKVLSYITQYKVNNGVEKLKKLLT
jgi:hypothetical protein